MQKLLWQSQILINRRINRCIGTLKHLHPLTAIVLITSITYTFESQECFLLKLFSFYFSFIMSTYHSSAREIITFLPFYLLQAASFNRVPQGTERLY